MSPSCRSTLPPRAEPGQAVVRERRPRLREDEDDHPGDRAPARCRRARRAALDAPVGPEPCRERGRRPPRATRLAGAATPAGYERHPDRGDDLLRRRATAIQLMNSFAAPVGAPRRDQPEVTRRRRTGRTSRCAGCTRRPCSGTSCRPLVKSKRDVADRVRVGLDRLLHAGRWTASGWRCRRPRRSGP